MSEEDRLILVDSEDREVGTLEKEACHDGFGVRHRAFSVLLFDGGGRQLIQKRAAGKRLWADHWSNACCSHPRVGETLEVATARRLQEELGVACEIRRVHRFEYHAMDGERGSEYEVCSVYVGTIDDPTSIELNPDEVSELRWMSATELDDELRARPEEFTPWFKMEWSTIRSMPERELGITLTGEQPDTRG